MNSTTVSTVGSLSLFREAMTDNLFPALIQCFGIIIIGYIFGWCKILNQQGAKGLCLFLQYLALPALIFTSLATITVSNVKWSFIAAILVAKVVIFVTVAIATMIMTKPTHIGKSGIYAIASTQSNDLAMGYPFMTALYKTTHPAFPNILYIVVPIQLLILNPVGFFLMETYKRKTDPQYSQQHSGWHIIKGVFKNPIIIATILGVVWNLAFHHQLTSYLDQLLQSIAIVFSPLALFLLGHSMSCGVKAVKGYFSLTPAIIVLAKILVLPLVLQKITVWFLYDDKESEIQDYSSLGFLYGTIPCAPTIFIFAKQYDIAPNIIASVTVYSTLFSGPLMVISATMISLAQSGLQNVTPYLKDTITYTSVINMSCSIAILILFMIQKKWRDICITSVICIVFAQMFMSVGGILFFLDSGNNIHLLGIQYILSLGGLFLTRFFGIFLAVLIFLLQKRSLCFVLQHRLLINCIGLVVPLGVAAILTISLKQDTLDKSWNMDFQFSYIQVATVLMVTVITLTFAVIFLILQHKYMRTTNFSDNTESGDASQQLLSGAHASHTLSSAVDEYGSDVECTFGSPNPSDIEDVAQEFEDISGSIQEHNMQQRKFFKHTCDSQYNCNAERRLQCSSQIENYKEDIAIPDVEINEQYVKYVILLLSLISSMIISIMVSISWLRKRDSSGIRIELQFLDVILSYGQGIICFILFGLSEIFSIVRSCCSLRRTSINPNEVHDQEILVS